jgi:hypothetical protein
LATDELFASLVADVAGACGVEWGATGGGDTGSGAVVCWGRGSGGRWWCGSATVTESTAGLASLGLGTDTRADARGSCAAARAAVSAGEALAADELFASLVADVAGACGVKWRATVLLGRDDGDKSANGGDGE